MIVHNAQVTDPKVVELPDDRIDTYLRAIRPEINPQLQASCNDTG